MRTVIREGGHCRLYLSSSRQFYSYSLESRCWMFEQQQEERVIALLVVLLRFFALSSFLDDSPLGVGFSLSVFVARSLLLLRSGFFFLFSLVGARRSMVACHLSVASVCYSWRLLKLLLLLLSLLAAVVILLRHSSSSLSGSSSWDLCFRLSSQFRQDRLAVWPSLARYNNLFISSICWYKQFRMMSWDNKRLIYNDRLKFVFVFLFFVSNSICHLEKTNSVA